MDVIGEHLRRAAARPLVWALLVGAVYLVLSRLSLAFLSDETGVATMWPASGIALVALVLAPRRWWPALTAGVVAGNLIAQLLVRDSAATAIGLAAVNGVETVLAGLIVTRVNGARRVDITSVRAVAAVAAAAFGAAAIGGVLATAVLHGVEGPLLRTWESWWLADGVGMLVIGPVLLALASPSPGRATRLETVALVWMTGALTLALFAHSPGTGPVLLGYAFPLLPMLLWCALRLGTRATTIAVLVVAVITSVFTVRGDGPFAAARLTDVEQVQTVQSFLALAVLSTLLVGAVVVSQRRAEWRASAQAERLDMVLRASDAAIIGLDLDGIVTHFNPGAERLLGRRAADVLGRTMPKVADREQLRQRTVEAGLDQPSLELFVRAALRNETRDWTWIRSDGTRLTVSLAMSAQRDRDGRLTGLLAMATDVTERRAEQLRLAASEERHRLVLANMPDASIYLFDRDLVCVLGEGQAVPEQLDPSDYLGHTAAELLEATPHLVARWTAALAGEPWHGVYRSPRTDRLHEMHVLPHRDDHGEPNGVLVVMRDITERQEAEQKVRRAEADLRTIFEEAPIGNVVCDARLRLVDANAALAAMTGYATDELGDVGLGAITDERRRREAMRLMNRVRRGAQRDAEIELPFRHAEGHVVHLSAHIVGLGVDGDGDGSRRRTLVQVLDVSDRKRFEEQLRHLAEHDPLTGVLNRRRFDQELAAHVGRTRRYGADGAVLLVDIDHFKEINDTHGHAAGDVLIQRVAQVLTARLRATDVLARIGGDEFAILLPCGGADDARAAARGLVEAIRAQTDVTISVGAAPVQRAVPLTAEALMRDADRAMYLVKAAGRDGVAVFGDVALSDLAAWPAPLAHRTSSPRSGG